MRQNFFLGKTNTCELNFKVFKNENDKFCPECHSFDIRDLGEFKAEGLEFMLEMCRDCHFTFNVLLSESRLHPRSKYF